MGRLHPPPSKDPRGLFDGNTPKANNVPKKRTYFYDVELQEKTSCGSFYPALIFNRRPPAHINGEML